MRPQEQYDGRRPPANELGALIAAMRQRVAGLSAWLTGIALAALLALGFAVMALSDLRTLRDTEGQPPQVGIGRALSITYPERSDSELDPKPLVRAEFRGRDYQAPLVANIGRIGPDGKPVRVQYLRGKSGEVYVNRVLGPK